MTSTWFTDVTKSQIDWLPLLKHGPPGLGVVDNQALKVPAFMTSFDCNFIKSIQCQWMHSYDSYLSFIS
jgi:hypothetical protein